MKDRNPADLARRYLIFLAGLFVASMGVAFSTIAGLGTSPVASVPYAVSLVSPLLSLGGWLNVLSVILGIGLWIQYKGGVALLPAEALNRAISKVTGKKYENIKIFFDAFYVTVAAAISLAFLGELKGVREGSIIAALGVGFVIKALNRLFDRITGQSKPMTPDI